MTTALVTGAGRGMGLEFTRQLLSRGHTVFATARDPSRSGALGELAAEHEGRLHSVPLDVSDLESIAAARRAIGERTGHLDLLVNNAGINSRGVPEGQGNVRFGALEPAGVLRMVEVNAMGPVLITQGFVDLLQKGKEPRVISVSSWLGSIGAKTSGGNYGYCASKATLNMLARAMAFDLLPLGIISVVFNPGWVSTDMGGPKAKLTPEESVAGMLKVTDGLTPQHAGQFLQWDGSEHPW